MSITEPSTIQDWTALIVAMTGFVSIIGLQIKTIMEQYSSKKRGQVRDTKLDTIKDGVDGVTTKLVKVTGDAEFAKGIIQGEADAHAKQDT